MSVTHIPFAKLGGNDHGWLDTKHHFSFADYRDPDRMCFYELFVVNDDTIAPRSGFPLHPHANVEIITYVRSGAISHEDDQGNKGRTTAGNVQVMSAGSGIRHSEHNLGDEEAKIFQIWIKTRSEGVSPRWDSAEFPRQASGDGLTLLVNGDDSDTSCLTINQDARIHGGTLKAGNEFEHPVQGQAYVLLASGKAMVAGLAMLPGDGLEVRDEKLLSIRAQDDSEVLVIEVPGKEKAR